MARPPAPAAVLFDVDGTLVDTNYLHVFAWIGAFHAVGHPVDSAAIHRAVGMGSSQLLDRLLGSDAARQVADQVKDADTLRYQETLPLMRTFDGARELLKVMAKQATVVLATSAQPEELSALRRVLDADSVITAITSAEDVEAAKPEPDLVEVALQKAGVPPEHAVFVGDTVWDIEASNRAGVPCVAVLSGGIGRAELEDAGAVAVYRDVAELLARLDASPLA